MKRIKEDFLYYIWKTKSFDQSNLRTIDGLPIQIEQFGYQNVNSGPDFSDAKVRVGDTLWAGNVEMHIFSSDWKAHKHELDEAYKNVILHVVYEHDKSIVFQKENPELVIPTVELKHYIDPKLITTYRGFLESKSWVPCQNVLTPKAKEVFKLWRYNLTIQRLWEKTAYIEDLLSNNSDNWEEVTYIVASRYFGATANSDAFEQLAKITPLHTLLKNSNDPIKMQALLFGQAGFLQANFEDDYFLRLKKEYAYQKSKHKLTPMLTSVWKFGRMRPHGLPTFRLAQFEALLSSKKLSFSSILDAKSSKDIYKLLEVVTDEYWEDHFVFGTPSAHHKTNLSKAFIDRLIINVFVPILFLYGKKTHTESYVDQSINLLESIGSESNNIIKKWKELHLNADHAFDSQALIQLKKSYCDKLQCMNCNIGHSIMSTK